MKRDPQHFPHMFVSLAVDFPHPEELTLKRHKNSLWPNLQLLLTSILIQYFLVLRHIELEFVYFVNTFFDQQFDIWQSY